LGWGIVEEDPVAQRQNKPLQPRPESKFPPISPVDEDEIESPTLLTLGKVIYNTVARLFHDPAGMVLGSTFLLILLWGTHGKVQLLGKVWGSWAPGSDPASRDSIIPGVPWDQEWLSFLIGAVLLVAIPVLLIKLVYKQDLADYGLALPPLDRAKFAILSAGALLVVGGFVFLMGAGDEEMQATYPLYRGEFESNLHFAVYELGYLPFFFAIEFVFRGYLLFGLYQFRDRDAPPGVAGAPGPFVFGHYSIFIAMLSYTAWHLGKPLAETWGTIVWGLVTGPIALKSRSIIPLIIVHWLLNVFLDLAIWQGWGI
jgi:hypothetical protein